MLDSLAGKVRTIIAISRRSLVKMFTIYYFTIQAGFWFIYGSEQAT
jgi:hypothetical protein